MESINIKAARKLVQAYESFTVPENKNTVKINYIPVHDAWQSIKRCNTDKACILCTDAIKLSDKLSDFDHMCKYCIYYSEDYPDTPCYLGANGRTYMAMLYATNYEDLQKAMLDRAAHIRKLVKKKFDIDL